MINYMTATAATLQTNSSTITVTGESVDFSKIDENYLVLLDNGLYVMPVISGTTFNDSGTSTLTLTESWQGAPLTNKKLLVLPVFAKIYETVATMSALNDVTRGILMNLKDLLTSTSPTLELQVGTTATINTIPYGYLANQVQSAIDSLNDLADSFGTAASKDVTTSATDTTEGRLLTVGYGGLGGNRVTKDVYGNDIGLAAADSSRFGGMIMEVAVDTANKPSFANSSVAGTLYVSRFSLVFRAQFPSSEAGNVYTGFYDGTDIIWSKSYDSGNTNFDEFGGTGTGTSASAIVATGVMISDDIARFFIPLNGVTKPTSVSFTGNFTIFGNSTNLGTLTSLAFNTVVSGNRVAVIQKSDITGSAINETLTLRQETSASKITVNF
jgi:hypothetical protein